MPIKIQSDLPVKQNWKKRIYSSWTKTELFHRI